MKRRLGRPKLSTIEHTDPKQPRTIAQSGYTIFGATAQPLRRVQATIRSSGNESVIPANSGSWSKAGRRTISCHGFLLSLELRFGVSVVRVIAKIDLRFL
ncbi:hypothetical protein ACFL2Q_00885 [Thermodesulfobacteriota bacterium]